MERDLPVHATVTGRIFFCVWVILTAIGKTQPVHATSKEIDQITLAQSFGPPASELKKAKGDRIQKGGRSSSPQETSPRFSLGLGANIPDFFPLEGYLRFNRFLGLRVFYVPTLPFNLRVELPRDQLSSTGGITVENPDLNVKFDGKYGPQYGAEVMVFPTLGSFYVSAGISHRRLALDGGVSSDLILRSTASGSSIDTNTNFGIETQASTAQMVFRSALGWMWDIWMDRGYFNLTLIGITIPKKTSSTINVTASITNPNASDPDGAIPDALAETKAAKEAEMEDKALDAMKPVEKLVLPLIGISTGIHF